ncbi:MAG TPA: 6,7-dimethyl-8-ribityllumazine synthase [Gaiellaceae bacterium]
MSEQEPITPDPGQPAPFDHDQNPWPGQPGYQPLNLEGEAPQEPAPEVDQAVAEAYAAADLGADPAYAGEHAEGELNIPAGYRTIEGFPTGSGRSVAIAVSRFNGEITNGLLESALGELGRLGVGGDAITIMPVPGAFELPLAAMALSKSRRYSCVIALGCVIKGETPHFEYVAGEAASGVLLAGLETGVPVAFGVLTVDTIEQAQARLGKGAEAVESALEMADAFARLRVVAGG